MKRKLESRYKTGLRKKILGRYPGCVVINNDPVDNQGVPDICVFYKSSWAMLEGKRSKDSSFRPNQEYYVDLYNDMGFASGIYPENEEIVLKELDDWFKLVDLFEIKKHFIFLSKKKG